jgi:PIN domain nuclease of toxin-antitoxin system
VVSSASVWEIGIEREMGKPTFPGSPVVEIVESGFEPLSISPAHAERAGDLPGLHRDPFDRMLVAQAQLEGLTVVTRDRTIPRDDVDVLAC